jgi:hypothetical protein
LIATSTQTIAQTINIRIVDTGGVIAPGSTRITALSTLRYQADMLTSTSLPVGAYSGAFVVSLCFDSPTICSSQPLGSPWVIQYTVRVR